METPNVAPKENDVPPYFTARDIGQLALFEMEVTLIPRSIYDELGDPRSILQEEDY